MSTKAYVEVTVTPLDAEHCSPECRYFRPAVQGDVHVGCGLPVPGGSRRIGPECLRTKQCIEAERRAEACPPEEPKAPPDPSAPWPCCSARRNDVADHLVLVSIRRRAPNPERPEDDCQCSEDCPYLCFSPQPTKGPPAQCTLHGATISLWGQAHAWVPSGACNTAVAIGAGDREDWYRESAE